MIGYFPFNDMISVQVAKKGFDEYGLPLKSPFIRVPCLLQASEDLKSVGNTDGKLIISHYTVFLSPDLDVPSGSVVVIDGEEYTVLQKTYKRDLSGNRVMLKLVV